MQFTHFLRKSLSLLICLSVLLSLGLGFTTVHAANIPAQDLEATSEKPDTKDVRGPDYVFLDFKVGSASRSFNWQVKTDSSSNPYFAATKQGMLAAYFQGDDPRLYMPVETTDSGKNRLNSYVMQSGDVIQVRIAETTANKFFTDGGTDTYNSYFTIRTSNDADAWASCGTTTIARHINGQTLQWDTPAPQAGKTLYGVRWDPIQPTDAQKGTFTEPTRIYLDYIYVGPANTAPVSVQFLQEDGRGFTQGFGYVGYGKKAPNWSHGKVDARTSTEQTIWGWAVHQEINGTWTDMKKFVTDPTTFTCKYNTRFKLTKMTLPLSANYGAASYTPLYGAEDQYTLTMEATSGAETNIKQFGTPLDVCFVMDRSGSQGKLASTKRFTSLDAMNTYLDSLDKQKWTGYYRASCWRRNNPNGSSYGKDYVYHMPMRYYRGQWQMQVLTKSCDCNGTSHRNYGIYPWNSTGMKQCSHVKWVSMEDGFTLYQDLCTAQGYSLSSVPFEIGPSYLGKSQAAIEPFLQKLYNSTENLEPGQVHTVSVIGYGATVFINGYPYSDQIGQYKTSNNYNASKVSTALTHNNYESILKCMRDSYVNGATRTDAAFQVLSGERSAIEKQAGKSDATQTKTDYLPAATSGRKRIVIFLSNGVPTDSLDFTNTIATDAIDASRRLKANSSTKVYCVGIMSGLDGTTYYKAAYATGTETQKANNFLNLMSSRYKEATAYNSPGTKTTGDYFLTDTSAGSSIADQYHSIWSAITGKISATSNLRLYGEISPEFKRTTHLPIKVYAAAHTGNGTYGKKVLIGQHDFTVGTVYGTGYKLSLTEQTVELIWTESAIAYPRNTSENLDSAISTLDISKGYSISIEVPLSFRYDSDPGASTIPLLTENSGLYTSTSAGDRNQKLKDFSPLSVTVPLMGTPALQSRSLSLEGNISINFYMSLPKWVVNDPNAYMQFTYADGRTTTLHWGDPGTSYSEAKDLYGFSCEVTAKEMADQIRCQFFYGNGKSTEESTYSVKTYADRILSLDGYEKLRNLLSAMLHYGGASQIQFQYQLDNLANQGMTVPDYSQVAIEGYNTPKGQGTSLVTHAGTCLLLESKTTLRLYFRADSSVAEEFIVTHMGQPLTKEMRGDLYYVDIPNITADQLDEMVTVTLSHGEETAEVTYCPLSYCASVLANVNGIHTRELQDVAAALYLYNQAANAYFASIA